MKKRKNRTRIHPRSKPSYLLQQVEWACGTARLLGITWTIQRNLRLDPFTVVPKMIWVTTKEGQTLGCEGWLHFVSFIQETYKEKLKIKPL